MVETDNDSKDYRNFPITTTSTDGGTTLGSCPCDKDRKAADNNPSNANLRGSSCDVCSSDDPKARMAEAAEPPKSPATFVDCCTNSTSCLWRAYPISESYHSRATSECFGFWSRALGDSTDFGFAGDDRDSPTDWRPVAAVSSMSAILARQSYVPASSMNLLPDACPCNCHAVAFAIAVNMSM